MHVAHLLFVAHHAQVAQVIAHFSEARHSHAFYHEQHDQALVAHSIIVLQFAETQQTYMNLYLGCAPHQTAGYSKKA